MARDKPADDENKDKAAAKSARDIRLADALRANLGRRKAQLRARGEKAGDEPDEKT